MADTTASDITPEWHRIIKQMEAMAGRLTAPYESAEFLIGGATACAMGLVLIRENAPHHEVESGLLGIGATLIKLAYREVETAHLAATRLADLIKKGGNNG